MVQHRKRGWELPGGKIDKIDTETVKEIDRQRKEWIDRQASNFSLSLSPSLSLSLNKYSYPSLSLSYMEIDGEYYETPFNAIIREIEEESSLNIRQIVERETEERERQEEKGKKKQRDEVNDRQTDTEIDDPLSIYQLGYFYWLEPDNQWSIKWVFAIYLSHSLSTTSLSTPSLSNPTPSTDSLSAVSLASHIYPSFSSLSPSIYLSSKFGLPIKYLKEYDDAFITSSSLSTPPPPTLGRETATSSWFYPPPNWDHIIENVALSPFSLSTPSLSTSTQSTPTLSNSSLSAASFSIPSPSNQFSYFLADNVYSIGLEAALKWVKNRTKGDRYIESIISIR
jgi:8-oxo-dGTP pyrophosphatase MutT (NUDIX family)